MTSEWIKVSDELPKCLETVWISNGKGWTTLGCRSDIYGDGEGGYVWSWCVLVGGVVYEEDGEIIGECEQDDYDVQLWLPVPKPPKQ